MTEQPPEKIKAEIEKLVKSQLMMSNVSMKFFSMKHVQVKIFENTNSILCLTILAVRYSRIIRKKFGFFFLILFIDDQQQNEHTMET